MTEMSEWALAALVTAEDVLEREFGERLRESSSLAFRVAYGVLRHREDAEDVAQEAFVRAHRSIAQLRDRERFRAWLVRMTWRLAIDRLRTDKRRAIREMTAEPEPGLTAEQLASAAGARAAAVGGDRRAAGEAADGHRARVDRRTRRRGSRTAAGHPGRHREVETVPGEETARGETAMFSEQDVDRELKAALSVSPSPDFEARVLQRVEADRPSHWAAHYGWLAAAAARRHRRGRVLCAEPDVSRRRSRTADQRVVRAPRANRRSRDAAAQKRPHRTAASPSVRAAARRGREARHARAPRAAEPEVIVPANQMEAVRRLVRAVNEGRLSKRRPNRRKGRWRRRRHIGVAPVVVEPIPLSPLGPGRRRRHRTSEA